MNESITYDGKHVRSGNRLVYSDQPLKGQKLLRIMKYSRSKHGPILLILPVALLIVLFCLPLLYVFLRAMEAGWDEAIALIFRPRVYELLFNTIKLDIIVTVLATTLGLTTAWFIERSDLPGRKIWNVLVTLPFAVPAFVSGYSWISIFPELEGFIGATLVLTLSYYPLVHLPVVAALRGMDPALEEISRSLGYTRWQTFYKVTLPHLRPALFGGAILVSLHILAEFGALAFLNYDTFTTAIFDQYEVAFNGASAAMLTFLLLLLCLFVLTLEIWLRGSHNYASVRKGVSGTLERVHLGNKLAISIISFCFLAVLAIGIPIGSLIYWLITGSSAGFDFVEIGSALYATVEFGFGGAALGIIFALPLVILAIRYKGIFSIIADRVPYFIHSLPGLVIGLTFVFFAVRYLNPLYQTVPLLLVAYAMLYLPLAQSSIRGVMVQVPRQLEEIAQSLGKNPLTIFFRVVLPLILPGIGAGFALVSLKVMTELTATLILRPTGVDTLATKIWQYTTDVQYAASAPYAVLLILISGLPVYLLTMRAFAQRKE